MAEPKLTCRAFDRMFASATERTLNSLEAAGHRIQTPASGSVIVDDTTIDSPEWEAAMASDCPVEAIRNILARTADYGDHVRPV